MRNTKKFRPDSMTVIYTDVMRPGRKPFDEKP